MSFDDMEDSIEVQNQRRLASFLKFVLEADRLVQREAGPFRAQMAVALPRAASMGCLLAVYRQGKAVGVEIVIPTSVEAVKIRGAALGLEAYEPEGRVLYGYFGLVAKKYRDGDVFEELLRTAHRNFPRTEALVFHRTLKDNGRRLHLIDFERKEQQWAAASEERLAGRSGPSVSASRVKRNGRRASDVLEVASPTPSTS